MKYIDDETLMFKVKKGEIDYIKIIFDKYHVHIYNYFFKITFDKIISQDLTQNVFFRIIKYRKTYKENSNFRAWIYQIFRNTYNDSYKKEKVYSFYNEGHKVFENEYSFDEEGEREKTLYTALLKMPKDLREILILNRFQGLKYKEIAEMNGSTEGAIKIKACRALNKLRGIYFHLDKM